MEMYLPRLARAYRHAVGARLAGDSEFAEWGVRPPSVGTLRVIDHHGPISQREVCEHLGMHPSDMVAIIDRLEASGLVTRERSTTDRRRYDLTLTLKGRSWLDRFAAIAREVDHEFYGVLSVAECQQLEKLLGKLVEAHSAGRSTAEVATPASAARTPRQRS
ncbi:MAG: transcriptional regulator, MarR family [Frankiales bacterium]|nr:transcriptional regulator, MarR family [Frankiales bacterium]